LKSENDTLINRAISAEKEADLNIDIDSINNDPNEFNKILTKRLFTTHELWNNLLKKYVSENGHVNYKGFKTDQLELYNYFKVLNVSLPNGTHSKAYTVAYWINAYNAFTIDLILRNYPVKSIKYIKSPWQKRLWKLGEKWYNLDDIEHQILRKMDEPRIHFAIVCASVSCPKLLNEAFTEENLEEQLTKATKDFLNDNSKNSIAKNKLELSKIFKWFSLDFTKKGSIIDFLNLYSDLKISPKTNISFKDYNWNLNE
jgi:hypothetical protein